MKVYICTLYANDYDSKPTIEKVFLNENDAKEYMKNFNASNNPLMYDMEYDEYEVE